MTTWTRRSRLVLRSEGIRDVAAECHPLGAHYVADDHRAALARHLERTTEKLLSGVDGKVREAIHQSITRILMGVDGTVTLETKPDGLLGVNAIDVRLDGEEEGELIQQSFHSANDRRWRVNMASM